MNNSTRTWIHGISLMFNCKATNTYKFYCTTFKSEAMCPHYTFIQNLFTTHTYLTFAFSLINTDGTNAAVDPCWGRVIHQTLPSLTFFAPPIQEGSGNQTTQRHEYALPRLPETSEVKTPLYSGHYRWHQ